MKPKAIALFTILLALFAGSALAAEKWIHINVISDDDERVTVNLPLSLVSAAAALIPDDVQHEVNREIEVALDDVHFRWEDLLTFWREVRNAPEATFVTVQTRDEKVEVKKEGHFVLVKTTEVTSSRGTQVDVKFPLAVVDALFSGPEGTLNFEAALHALAEAPNGHIVSVQDRDATVKIWIDEQNEAE
jgi:hypothetical protein